MARRKRTNSSKKSTSLAEAGYFGKMGGINPLCSNSKFQVSARGDKQVDENVHVKKKLHQLLVIQRLQPCFELLFAALCRGFRER